MTRTEDLNHLRIETSGLRVEFDGGGDPTRLVVPIVFPVGTHRDVCLRIHPRSDVILRNEADVGDAFRATFSQAHTTSGGVSFFASASHGRTYGRAEKPYDVVHLEDLRGVRFRLTYFDVSQEPIALQVAFPVSIRGENTDEDYFAEIALEINSQIIQQVRLAREVHATGGKVLLVSGYSEELESKTFPVRSRQNTAEQISFANAKPQISGMRRRYLQITENFRPTLSELRSLARNHQGLHIYTNVDNRGILINDSYVDTDTFFAELSGIGLKFVFIATCNSVRVVSSFRATDMCALIAATENLEVNYAEKFESSFYEALGSGSFISKAYQTAALLSQRGISAMRTRSGQYNPMFLELKSDFRLGSIS